MAAKGLIIGDVIIALVNDKKNYGRYLNEVAKFGLLTIDEEVEYFQKFRAGETKYYNKIAERNLRFVISVAKKFQNVVAFTTALTLEDLISEGNLGLCEAIHRYDETRGFKFISFAVHYIRSYINTAIYRHLRTIRMPQNRQVVLYKLTKLENELQQEYHIDEIPTELLQQYAVEKNIESASMISDIKKFTNSGTSLDASNSNEICLKDMIEDVSIEGPFSTLLNKEKADYLKSILDKIPERVAEYITLHYGLNNQPALEIKEIAKIHNVGNEVVRFQIRRWTAKMYRPNVEDYKQYN